MTISKERHSELSEDTEFSITAQRAKTLNITAYDNDIGRFKLNKVKDWRWVKALADPADDLKYFYLLMRLPCQARHISRRRLQPFAIHFFCRIFLPNSHITVFMKITFHQRLTLRSDT